MKPADEAVLEGLDRWLGFEPLLTDVEAVYRDAESALAAHHPACQASGRCCHFGPFGHVLYVTSAELVHFLSRLPHEPASSDAETAAAVRTNLGQISLDACPFQVGRFCQVHAIRPLGCRLYFCAPGSTVWGGPLYEQYLARLKSLCGTRGLDYAYLEWTGALAALVGRGALPAAGPSPDR